MSAKTHPEGMMITHTIMDSLVQFFGSLKEHVPSDGTVATNLYALTSHLVGSSDELSVTATLLEALAKKIHDEGLRRKMLHAKSLRMILKGTQHVRDRVSIDTLPDDCLMEIFEQACGAQHDDPNFAQEVILSVSRRWRRVALNFARLWRNISNIQSTNLLTLYLERSRNVGLHVQFFISHPSGKLLTPVNKFLDLITQHDHRWEELVFVPEVMDDCGALETFKYGLRNLSLPKLRTLVLPPDIGERWEIARPIFEFFGKLETPRLSHLSASCYIFYNPKGVTNPIASVLRTCKLSISEFLNKDGFIINTAWDLKQFLSNHPSLKEVELVIETDLGGFFLDKAQKRVTLASALRVLKMSFSAGSTNSGPAQLFEFMQLLYAPNLEELNVDFSEGITGGEFEEWFNAVCPSYADPIKINVAVDRTTTLLDVLKAVFKKFRRVEEVSYTGKRLQDSDNLTYFEQFPPLDGYHLPKLRRLCVKSEAEAIGCNDLEEVNAILQGICKGAPKLKSIEIGQNGQGLGQSYKKVVKRGAVEVIQVWNPFTIA